MSTHHFVFPQPAATGYQLELLIRQYGIPVFNRYAGQGRIEFDVPARQAKWATYIFQRAGIMTVADANGVATPTRGPLPRAWGVGVRRRSLGALWVDFLAGLIGAPGLSKSWQAKTKGQRR